jgi:hypothetical protein
MLGGPTTEPVLISLIWIAALFLVLAPLAVWRYRRAIRPRPLRPTSGRLGSWHGGDLDEVAAGVVEDCGGDPARLQRFLSEDHPEPFESFVLGCHVVDCE